MSQKSHNQSQEDIFTCDLSFNLSRHACSHFAVVSYVSSFTKFQLMPVALRNMRVRLFQSWGPEMVTGVTALFWLWNQPAELNRVCKYLMTNWHHPWWEILGSLTVPALNSSLIAHSCLEVQTPALEWQTVNCFPQSSAWITHSPHWRNSSKETRDTPTHHQTAHKTHAQSKWIKRIFISCT